MSIWLGDNETNESVLAIAQGLLEHQRDFDFVDDRSLGSVLKLDGGELKNLSGQTYGAVVVPSVSAMSKAALDQLKAFAAAGGKVLFLGDGPSMVVGRTFLDAGGPVDLSWAVRVSGELTAKVLGALPKPDVTLDKPCPAVKYVHRCWRDADLYFFFNESTEELSCSAVLAGNGRAQIWDATSGNIETLSGIVSEKGSVSLPLELEPHGTKFIVVTPLPSGDAS